MTIVGPGFGSHYILPYRIFTAPNSFYAYYTPSDSYRYLAQPDDYHMKRHSHFQRKMGEATPQRTLAISNFPNDTKERELNNLLLFFPGYQASMMIWGEAGLEGRAIFLTHSQAQEAMSKLDGLEFESGWFISAAFAPEELNISMEISSMSIPLLSEDKYKSRPGDVYPPSPSAEIKTPPPFGPPPPTSSILPPTAYSPLSGERGLHQFHQQHERGAGSVASVGGTSVTTSGHQQLPSTPRYAPVKNEKDNLPCNTLFIGNLGEDVDQDELRSVFASLPGFQQLKVVKSPRGISAFIEFSDIATATTAHETQQGLILESSDKGPIRVQYSKNPFGRKREVGGTTAVPGPPMGMMPTINVSPIYAPYAMPIPQHVLPPGYMYGASPAAQAAVFSPTFVRQPPPPPLPPPHFSVPPPGIQPPTTLSQPGSSQGSRSRSPEES